VIETLIGKALTAAGVTDPDIDNQDLTAQRALRELNRVRSVILTTTGRTINLTTRRSALQAQILTALDVDTTTWDKAHIT